LASLLAGVALMLPAVPSVAQEDDSNIRLSLESISPWVDDAQPFSVVARVRNLDEQPRADLTLEVWLLQPVTSRSALAAAVAGGSSSITASRQVTDITVTTSRRVQLTATHQELGSLGLGIYPVSIRLRDSSQVLAEIRTAIPVVSDAPDTRIRLLTAFSIVDPDPPVKLQGGFDPETIDVNQLRLAADRLDALEGTRPLIEVDGATVDAVADLSGGALSRTSDGRISNIDADSPTAVESSRLLSALRRMSSRAAIATSPYVPIDLSALTSSGAGSRIKRQFRRADNAFQEHLGTAPADVLYAPDLSARDRFRSDAAVVGPLAIANVQEAPFSPDLFGISTPVGLDELKIMVWDERLRELSLGESGWLADAQTIVAETALRWLELPLAADERLLVFSPDPDAPSRLLEHVADATRSAPWLNRVLLDQTGEPEGTAVLAQDSEPVRTLSLAVPAASRALRAIRSIIPEDAGDVAQARIAEWESALLISERVTDEGVGDAELADLVREDIEAHLDRVRAEPDRRALLTSGRGVIPVVLVNDNDFSVNIGVHLAGRRISFPEGRDFPVRVDPGDKTIDVAVEVLGQGEFPLEVSVSTPSGTVLSSTVVDLRSTRVNRVALFVVGGALGFLFLQAFRRRRKAPR
jgi:hypothetical protein